MDRGAAGHRPVLLREVCDLLEPQGRGVLVDCTVGLGGHSQALLELAGGDAQLIGLDVDEANLRLAKERLSRFGARVRLFQANFSQLEAVLREANLSGADAILADLGVASSQLDDPQRGLSFSAEGPLDMRLDQQIVRTAADLVNEMKEEPLADLIYQYGQERYSRRIARAIVAARKAGRIESTTQLADIVMRAMPAPVRHARRGMHPATRTFQALRIAVNDEMGNLQTLLDSLPMLLRVGGRAAVISFHSLEDGPVKRAFAQWAQSGSAQLLTKKPLTAGEDEERDNPRSRSAKLRGIVRIS